VGGIDELTAAGETTVRRLNWGCGKHPPAGWINSDAAGWDGVDYVVDILEGLPIERDSIDYAVSVHALPEIPYADLLAALHELKRVLKPGGTLRLVLPDIDKGIDAYHRGDRDYFLVPDEDANTIAAKVVVQTIWYGHTRTPFNHDFIEELLLKDGFAQVHRCAFQQTASPFPEIVTVDNRERESLFVEAVK
jgi:predicted SAM-dependent methyltransferase